MYLEHGCAAGLAAGVGPGAGESDTDAGGLLGRCAGGAHGGSTAGAGSAWEFGCRRLRARVGVPGWYCPSVRGTCRCSVVTAASGSFRATILARADVFR